MDTVAIVNLVKDFGPWTFSAFLFYLWGKEREDKQAERSRVNALEDSRLELAKSTAVLAEKLSDAVDDLVQLSHRSTP